MHDIVHVLFVAVLLIKERCNVLDATLGLMEPVLDQTLEGPQPVLWILYTHTHTHTHTHTLIQCTCTCTCTYTHIVPVLTFLRGSDLLLRKVKALVTADMTDISRAFPSDLYFSFSFRVKAWNENISLRALREVT